MESSLKRLISVIVLLTVSILDASYYGNSEINTYDAATGFYYKAIVSVEEGKGFLSSTKSIRKITNIAKYKPRPDTY